jgi:hypothetical protein
LLIHPTWAFEGGTGKPIADDHRGVERWAAGTAAPDSLPAACGCISLTLRDGRGFEVSGEGGSPHRAKSAKRGPVSIGADSDRTRRRFQ